MNTPSPTANAQDVTVDPGTFACPICGKDTPHYHSPEEVKEHRDTEAWVEESWQQIRPIIFPDSAQDMTATLLAALTELADVFAHEGENSVARFDRLAAMFRNDTGYTAPGKDSAAGPVSQADRDELNAIYDAWYLAKVTRARAAIAKATAA